MFLFTNTRASAFCFQVTDRCGIMSLQHPPHKIRRIQRSSRNLSPTNATEAREGMAVMTLTIYMYICLAIVNSGVENHYGSLLRLSGVESETSLMHEAHRSVKYLRRNIL